MTMLLKNFVKLLRPEQWSKNLFIFLPAFFNGQLWNIGILLSSIAGFLAFSFAASSIYCFNDIFDVAADRLHPKKCQRPVASGAVSKKMAYVYMAFCLTLSVAILFLFCRQGRYGLPGVLLIYYVMNLAYCIRLKRYVIVDVIIISTGFVLRIFAGGFATGIWLSEWMIIMTFLLALFLAFSKRRDDVVLYIKTGIPPRETTNRYNLEFANQVISVIATITIIAYIMYTLSPEVMERFNSRYIYLTSIFVLAGIIRYLQVTIVYLKSGSPTKIFLRDKFIQACIFGWVVSFLVIIYF